MKVPSRWWRALQWCWLELGCILGSPSFLSPLSLSGMGNNPSQPRFPVLIKCRKISARGIRAATVASAPELWRHMASDIWDNRWWLQSHGVATAARQLGCRGSVASCPHSREIRGLLKIASLGKRDQEVCGGALFIFLGFLVLWD